MKMLIESMKSIYIYSKRCWIDEQFMEATLHLGNGKILDIYRNKYNKSNINFFDFKNAIIMPGIIDAHVHINEPGRTNWEGFDSATKAAAMGGVTSLIEMPLNADPVTTNVKAFNLKKEATKNKLNVNCGFYGGIIPNNTNEIEALIQAGVFGIKGFLTHSGIDEFSNVTKEDLEKIAPILAKYKIPLLLHCEIGKPIKSTKKIDPKNYTDYLESRPEKWELDAINIALEIQEKYNIKVHIVHLSSSLGLPMIIKQKKKSNKITVETCPHYLFFNSEDIPYASPIYKCAPPIREKKNMVELWEGVLKNEFDFLASDHSPAPPEMKKLEEGNFMKAWGGIAGLQFTLPVIWTAGQKKGMSLEKLIPLLTINPAKFLGLDDKKGQLKKGFDADITIWDEETDFKVTEKIIQHKHRATPYMNHILKGKIIHTFVNGVQVVKNNTLNTLNAGNLLLKSF
jgi:allantoinase